MTVTYTAAIPSNPSPQLKAALAFAPPMAARDKEALAALTTDDYTHTYLPEDFGIPTLSKDDFLGRINVFHLVLESFDLDLREIIEAPGVCGFHCGLVLTTKGGFVSKSEVLILLFVGEQPDGSYKVTRAREWIDTAKFASFGEVLKKELEGPSA